PDQIIHNYPSFTTKIRSFDCGVSGGLAPGILHALPYLVLVLLMGFTTYYQQRQLQGKSGGSDSQQQQQMQMMGRVMPIMLMFFAWLFPTAVTIYWLTTNGWTIAQQRLVLARI